MQCGIACLQMVCRYYGLKLPLSELSRRCSATVEGVSLLGISEAAQGLGLHTICGRVTAEMLREAPPALYPSLEPEPFRGAVQG